MTDDRGNVSIQPPKGFRSSKTDANNGEELVPLTLTPDSENSSSDKSTNQDIKIENLYKERPIASDFTKVAESVKCGCGNWKPDFLQFCNNPKWLLACLCIFSMFQGFVVNGINNVNTSTIERRFQLPSSRVGAISSSYDVSAAILGIIISYLGSGKHKPRMVAMAAVTMAFGSFVMTLPHFVTGLYEAGQNVAEVCSAVPDSVHQSANCADSENHLSAYFYVLLLGQALHGIGGTTLYIVGISLLDDSVTSSSSPMYVGILYAFATLGPALGYIIGGRLLDVYVDFHEPGSNSIGLSPEDPRWVGAWWIGFLSASVLFLVISVPIFCFGKELPDAEHIRNTRISQTHKSSKVKEIELDTKEKSFKNFLISSWAVLTNPPFILITLAGAAEGLSTSGFATFMPKFIQNQFGTTAAWASIVTGLVAVPGAAGGQFIGGYLCKRLNLKVKGMLKMCVIVCVTAMVLDSVVWIRCDQSAVAGVTSHYIDESETLPNLLINCNTNCSCLTELYEPVCGPNGLQYFSPCHAGCDQRSSANKNFLNCSCIASIPNITSSTATAGKCNDDCVILYLFLPILLFTIFFRFVQSPPSLSITLRVIPEKQRTLGLGLQWFVVRFLGTFPGPIFFGAVIDSTCLVWQEKCSEKTSCWIYDNASLSRNFFFILVSVKLLTSIFFILAYRVYQPPPESQVTYIRNNKDESSSDEQPQGTDGTVIMNDNFDFNSD